LDKDKEERKRPTHLRLVVSNPEKRTSRPAQEENFVPLEELVAQREALRVEFYKDIPPAQAKAYRMLERVLLEKGWPYGLDPHHGRVLVIPAGVVCAEAVEYGSPQDELLLFISDDFGGQGLCLSMEMILPYYSDDGSVMEDALLYGSPVLQYGTTFLEENPQDGLLDLIYRIGMPLYPPALTKRLVDRLLATAAFELRETILCLYDVPEE